MVFIPVHQSVSEQMAIPQILSSLILSSVKVKFPQILQTFLCYGLDRFYRWCIPDSFPPTHTPTHFVKSLFSGSHRYKPQAQKPSMDDCTRAYFFTVPSWMGANHSLCNSVKILLVLFSSSYSVV
jgi:hypothetical protein